MWSSSSLPLTHTYMQIPTGFHISAACTCSQTHPQRARLFSIISPEGSLLIHIVFWLLQFIAYFFIIYPGWCCCHKVFKLYLTQRQLSGHACNTNLNQASLSNLIFFFKNHISKICKQKVKIMTLWILFFIICQSKDQKWLRARVPERTWNKQDGNKKRT